MNVYYRASSQRFITPFLSILFFLSILRENRETYFNWLFEIDIETKTDSNRFIFYETRQLLFEYKQAKQSRKHFSELPGEF